MPRYWVMVDDNFHYQDAAERRQQGIYDSLDEALSACRAIVDRSLAEEYRPGISAERLYDRYVSFGDDLSSSFSTARMRAPFSQAGATRSCRAIVGEP